MKYQAARQIFVRLALMPCSRCPSNQLENKNTKEKNNKQIRLRLQTIILPILFISRRVSLRKVTFTRALVFARIAKSSDCSFCSVKTIKNKIYQKT